MSTIAEDINVKGAATLTLQFVLTKREINNSKIDLIELHKLRLRQSLLKALADEWPDFPVVVDIFQTLSAGRMLATDTVMVRSVMTVRKEKPNGSKHGP